MFTGIIQSTGIIAACRRSGGRTLLCVRTSRPSRAAIGSSIAVNGVCLTLARKKKNELWFELIEETRKKTTLGTLPVGARVNLERSLRVGDEVGGHFVFGHVDGVGEVVRAAATPQATHLTIRPPRALMRFIAPQGSVAVHGVSLTVADHTRDTFTVSLTSFTIQETTLGELKKGDRVNIECDMLAKYIFRGR